MVVKLDMSKAYDRVEWECLQLIMRKLGFHEKWISIVMRCVSSMKYGIRVNGQPCGQIRPTRGLKQGDPLCLTFLSSVLRGCRLFSIALPKEKLLEVWLLQLEGLEYYTYFLPMIAWCLEEHL